MEEKYSKGTVIQGTVYRIVPHFGILLRLQDQTRGFIRKRELSWEDKDPDPNEYIKIGQKIEAVVLSQDPESGSLNLSKRLRDWDPWDTVIKKYNQGDVIKGKISEILPARGAFVEIEPGIEGFIPISQIHPDNNICNVEDVLWIYDSITALITNIDLEARHIQLSMKAYIKQKHQELILYNHQRDAVTTLGDLLDRNIKDKLKHAITESQQPNKHKLKPNRIKNLLIVDDNENFGIPLIKWLQQNGYNAQLATTGEQGFDKIKKLNFDLIFMDAHLPDTNGIEVAQRIRDTSPQIPILLITGYEDDINVEMAAELGYPFRFKPISERDLQEILITLEDEGRLPGISHIMQRNRHDFFKQGVDSISSRASLTNTIETVLNELSNETSSNSFAVFSLDIRKREMSLIAAIGVPPLDSEQKHKLIYSPIYNVTEFNEVIYENNINERWFQYLLQWITFKSCIGVPIPAFHSDLSYALFSFHPEKEHYSDIHLAISRAAASVIGAAIGFQESETQLNLSQQLILKGQLGAGLLHEVHNRLGGALLTVNLMQSSIQKLAEKPSGDFSEILDYTDEVSDNLNKISESVRIFRRLSKEEAWESIDINHSIRQTISLLMPLAKRSKVEIKTDFENQLPHITSIRVRLDQILCNVVLNAIEWMAYQPVAFLQIKTYTTESDLPVIIEFSDTGPGIHQRLFNRIFELGFTTKEGGTGQGLYIAEGLVASIGGQLSVTSSTILIGSTFRLELPVSPLKKPVDNEVYE